MLVLYTDGIPERLNPAGSFFGVERIEQLASRLINLPAKAVAAALLAEADAFADGVPAQDDMTVVVVRRPPSASSGLGCRERR